MPRLFLILILVFTPIALPYAATQSSNVYEVEVVVFENRTPDLDGGELWKREPGKSADTETIDAVTAGEKPPADSLLSPAAATLEKSGQHHVLAHLRWQQSAETKSLSQPVKIINAESGLDGTLRFYLSRYLLVDVNLMLKEVTTGGIFGGADKEGLVYRLSERRRVKLSETHYFDHPRFGALVRVSPVKTN